MNIKDLKEANLNSYHDHISLKEARELHKENLKKAEAVVKWRENEGRPLSVLLVHGSGRNTNRCSAEKSNSEFLLERGFELAKEEFKDMELDDNRLVLSDMWIEHCNGCVSTTSALCQFTCTCHPHDDLSRHGYQMMLWADVVLMSTPVNQSMPASRLVQFIDRLISLDGGYYVDQLDYKNAEYKQKMIEVSKSNPVYDQRLYGKVGAYIITSKDLNNTHDDGMPGSNISYDTLVAGALRHSMSDYGIFHANNYYYIAASDPDVEYAHDKVEYSSEKHFNKAKEVVLDALKKGMEFRKNPPKFKGNGGRVNRT